VKWHYFADVTLACEDNKGILAHKVLLVSGSGFYRDNNLKMSEGGTSPSAKDKMAHFSEWNVQAQCQKACIVYMRVSVYKLS